MKFGIQALLVICGLTLALSSLAQAGDVMGVVADGSGQPIAGVKVIASNTRSSASAVTNHDGQYAIKNLAAGAYDLRLDPMGSSIKGGTVAGYLDPAGLTVNWAVSPQQEPLAAAEPGIGQNSYPSMGTVALSGGTFAKSEKDDHDCKGEHGDDNKGHGDDGPGHHGPPCPKSPHH